MVFLPPFSAVSIANGWVGGMGDRVGRDGVGGDKNPCLGQHPMSSHDAHTVAIDAP